MTELVLTNSSTIFVSSRSFSLVEHRDLSLFRIGGHEHVELGLQSAQRFRLERVLCQSPAERLVLRFLFESHCYSISR